MNNGKVVIFNQVAQAICVGLCDKYKQNRNQCRLLKKELMKNNIITDVMTYEDVKKNGELKKVLIT